MKFSNVSVVVVAIVVGIFVASIIGEVRCIIKATKCNWEPIGKAEVVYTGAAMTGLGAIVGWFDIEDK